MSSRRTVFFCIVELSTLVQVLTYIIELITIITSVKLPHYIDQ